MTHVIIRHQVRDFTEWLPHFQDHAPVRERYGCRKETVRQRLEDPNDVLIEMEWTDPGSFEDFMENSDVRDVMEEAGVIGEPEVSQFSEPIQARPVTR